MSENKLRGIVRYNAVFRGTFKRKKRRAAFIDILEKSLTKTVTAFFGDKEYTIRSGDDKNHTIYECSEGVLTLNDYEDRYPQVMVVERANNHTVLSSGRVLACALRVMQVRDICPDDVWLFYDGKESRISDLVALNVYARKGNTSACINTYALPLHYLNGRIIKKSAEGIASLEEKVLQDVKNSRGNETILVTAAAPVWELRKGSYEPFFDVTSKVYLLHKEVITSSGVPHSEPSPRSDGAQSP